VGLGRPCQTWLLVVLWEVGPLWREVRAGARLWARGPARRPELGRNWAQTEAQGGWLAWGPDPLSAEGKGAAPSQRSQQLLFLSRKLICCET
jgi:hypothetical protein